MRTNVLYYGDNLDILRHGYIPEESVDLVYLDPPFNSNRTYNVIFKDELGNRSDAQLVAFEDTWHWGPDAERQYAFLTNSAVHQGRVPDTVSTIIAALRSGLGENQMTAYLVEMAVRLVELRRVLKPTGSLYLHCDPTAGHYLKLVLDSIFGPDNFRDEIIWHYGGRGAKAVARQFPHNHDLLLLYSKSVGEQIYNRQFTTRRYTLEEAHDRGFRQDEERRWFKTAPRGDYTDESIAALEADGRIHRTRTGNVRVKYFLREVGGYIEEDSLVGDVWNDIPDAMHMGRRWLGWETQKPPALLERIVEASSNPGDVVLDPFCGCGTALVAAQKLGRQWVGIDITYLAIRIMRQQLEDSFPELRPIEVVGRPTEVTGAKELLAKGGLAGQYQFQWWALDLVGAMPKGGVQRKGADRGVDGVITFTGAAAKLETVIVSVKSGENVNAGMVQELKGAMDTHGAAMGLFVTLAEPTGPMRQEAAVAGFYHSDVSGKDYPRVQILTIRELVEAGKKPDLPPLILPTFQPAERVKRAADQTELFGGE